MSLSAMLHDWERVRPYLRVQLYSPAREAAVRDVVDDRLGRDLHRALVVDLPDRMMPVPAKVTAGWPGSRDEWLSAAVQSLIAAEEDVAPVDAGGYLVAHGTTYAAARVVHTIPKMRAPLGVVFGVPTRRSCLLHVLDTREAWLDVAPRMAHHVLDLHDGNEGAVSPHLHWYRNGTIRTVPTKRVDRDATVAEPPDLAALLARLPK